MHSVSLLLYRFPGTPYDFVPLRELVRGVIGGAATGVSEVCIGSCSNGSIAVSFSWGGYGLPAIPNAYIARFGLACAPSVQS